jgi:hypothetical protein
MARAIMLSLTVVTVTARLSFPVLRWQMPEGALNVDCRPGLQISHDDMGSMPSTKSRSALRDFVRQSLTLRNDDRRSRESIVCLCFRGR